MLNLVFNVLVWGCSEMIRDGYPPITNVEYGKWPGMDFCGNRRRQPDGASAIQRTPLNAKSSSGYLGQILGVPGYFFGNSNIDLSGQLLLGYNR